MLDLLLTAEATPLQSLVFEQAAKISAATVRKSWSEARRASGAMSLPADQRSVLGYAVDPLGLFKGSALVEVDDIDERALAASEKLLELLNTNADALPLASSVGDLSSAELSNLARILAPKLWERRAALLLSANRFTALLLSQAARRLETSSKRRTAAPAMPAVTPRATEVDVEVVTPQGTPVIQRGAGEQRQDLLPSFGQKSERLQKARSMLVSSAAAMQQP